MRHGLQPSDCIELIDLVGRITAVSNDTAKAYVVVFRLRTNRLHDAVHRKDRVEVVGGDDQGAICMLQGSGKASTHHVTQDIKDHHIGVF